MFSYLPIGSADESIGFLETFALAKDREAALGELIPGTEDYYFYSALLAQQRGELEKVGDFLDPWIKRHGTTARVTQIQHRQALLLYPESPEVTLQYLRDHLGLTFFHEQQKLDAKPDFPTSLEEGQAGWEAFREQALRRRDLSGVTDAGLDRLIRDQVPLTNLQRRELLGRVIYPDYDQFVGLIAADLRTRESKGFGEFAIHRNLTLSQLDALVAIRPELSNDPNFVETRLTKLRPGADVSLDRDPAARLTYLNDLWNYVGDLPTAFASLKAAILYRRLSALRDEGEFPREDFMTYLRLPRSVPYVAEGYLANQLGRGRIADLNADFTGSTGLPPVGNDEALVRDYLAHFFVEDETWDSFAPFIKEDWLKQHFAETKLLNGVGDAEEWFSLLNPAQVQELKERVEISFSPTNPEHFLQNTPVDLTVKLKNVSELLVKVYEVNALNFYLDQKEEINTDLNLDGLIANEEKTYRYDDAAILRRTEVFTFESLEKKRGVWVIELIGNGISSRALVRKGQLQYLSRTSPVGELVTILDEGNRKVKSPAVWFGGKRYDADENGIVLLPFSEKGRAPVVLTDGSFASFTEIDLPREEYAFDAGFLLNQESLLPGLEASVTIRPTLKVNGVPVSLSRLDGTRVEIATRDLDGVDSKTDSADLEASDESDLVQSFRVPNRVSEIVVTISGEVRSLTNPDEPIEVSASRSFAVNGVQSQTLIADAYLSLIDGEKIIEVLGKSGEPLTDRPVTIELLSRDFSDAIRLNLKTNERGRIDLGPLADVSLLRTSGEGLLNREWSLLGDRNSQEAIRHAVVGDVVQIPLPGVVGDLSRDEFAIFEVRQGLIVSDQFAKASFAGGLVTLEGLDAGDYLVLSKQDGQTSTLRVSAANESYGDYALAEHRHLQIENPNPLLISGIARDGEQLRISLNNTDPLSRVHVFATRFVPSFDPYADFDHGHVANPLQILRGTNATRYVSGRDIGEEYRYILERRGAPKFPGNMLSRPGLILNPWELSETNTAIDEAEEGEAQRRSTAQKKGVRAPGAPMPVGSADRRVAVGQSSSFDFLASQPFVLSNLTVDENGEVVIDLADLGDRQQLHVVAADGYNTAYRQLSLPEPDEATKFRDLRLKSSLDTEKNFSQRRHVTLLREGQTLTIDDLRSSELATYDTVGGIYESLASINPDENFAVFRFVSQWNHLEAAEKQERYSEFACHELHFFLAEKDPAFFDTVVLPYLNNKKDKTFLDHYLLGNPLDRYLQPWEFSGLNIVERILLGRRIGGDQTARTASHVASLHELIPTDPATEAAIFRQALRGVSNESTRLNLGVAAGGLAFETSAPMPVAAMSRGMQGRTRIVEPQEVAADPFAAPMADGFGFGDIAVTEEIALAQQLYRKLESTKEWAENNYYELPIEEQDAELVTVNGFWKDFAEWDGTGGFYSREFAGAASNFTEMMFVLSVLDLPFTTEEHDFTIEGDTLRLTANSPLVVFHEEIEESVLSDEETPILVSQNFFRVDDRYRYVDGQQVDKFVSDEFLTGVVYGSQVVVTNPTSSASQLDLLVQIPEGAIPVAGSDYTRSHPISLSPFSTQRQETQFYFPSVSGDAEFAVYPVQVAKEEKIIATGEAMSFPVVARPTVFDEASWEYLSQFGSAKEVTNFLSETNLHRIDLGKIAWRFREDVDFCKQITDLVASRHRYDTTLWSYGIFHNVPSITQEFLKHQDDFLEQCGPVLETELVSLDPIERKWHEHLEYAPLVNARTHRLGRDRKILNDRFRAQYDSFIRMLAYQGDLSAEDRLAVTAYLFLQDRVEEALAWLETVNAEEVGTQIQHDYLRAYASLYREEIETARGIAAGYADYPVEKWREKFAAVTAQVGEIEGGDAIEEEGETREATLERLSKTDPYLDLTSKGREVTVVSRNLQELTVNYYEMDLEFLFSSKPFVSGNSGQFSVIQPNRAQKLEVPGDGDPLVFSLPDEYASRNVLVEVVGGGQTESVAIYANSLRVQLAERYGRIEVRDADEDRPLSKTYVKVYAKMNNGEVRFFKDGYTDLRGKFDYVSLNTSELDDVDQLSLLVMSEENGALVREVSPPQR